MQPANASTNAPLNSMEEWEDFLKVRYPEEQSKSFKATDPNKKKEEFRFIGKSMARRDVPLKVNGTAMYGIDVEVPGMVYASTRHTPVAASLGVSRGWRGRETATGVRGAAPRSRRYCRCPPQRVE